jgi:hypothetical protein
VLPYLIHYHGWPEPKGLHTRLALTPPESLRREVRWHQNSVAPELVQRNRSALEAHHTQYEYSSHRLLALLRANELFGDFPAVALSPAATMPSRQPPSDLTAEEQASLLAVERYHAALENDDLVLTMQHSRPLAPQLELSLFAFGDRSDVRFAKMPKLHVKAGISEHEVYDQAIRLPSQNIAIHRKSNQTEIRIPLRLIGDPTRVLTTARTYVSDLPVDWTAWRTLELPRR